MSDSGEKTAYTRRAFLKKAGIVVGGGGALGLSLLWRGVVYEPNFISVETIDLVLPRLSPFFDGFRVVQLSDIHFDEPMLDGFILRVIQTIERLQPDILIFTGDYLGGTSPYHILSLQAALKRLDSRLIKLAILGNHDHFINPYAVRTILREAGFRLLRNACFTIGHQESALHFCGLDDVLWQKADLPALMHHIPSYGCAILLVHEPDFADYVPQPARFDLQLSGHTHGGQIVLPGVGPIFKPALGEKYVSGLATVGSMQVYTNRGLGQVSPHIRLNAPPEITLFRLHSSEYYIQNGRSV